MTRRHRLTCLGLTTLLLLPGACNTKPPKALTAPTGPPVVALAPAPLPPPPVEDATDKASVVGFAADPHKYMKAHFVRALKLQDAVLAGNLGQAKAEGRWLAGHDNEDVPVSWRAYLRPFRGAAKAVAEAPSVDEAAVAVAQMSAACGDCHAANHASPKIGSTPVVKGASNIKSHMAAQLAALDKLWNGLVIPSDVAWQEGAALLSKVVVTAKVLDKEGLGQVESGKVLTETLRQLSTVAGKAAKADRPAAYADLLSTCVACHSALRKPTTTTVEAPL